MTTFKRLKSEPNQIRRRLGDLEPGMWMPPPTFAVAMPPDTQGAVLAVIRCPGCQSSKFLVSGRYKIDADGNVSPQFVCESITGAVPVCGFADEISLGGWLDYLRDELSKLVKNNPGKLIEIAGDGTARPIEE